MYKTVSLLSVVLDCFTAVLDYYMLREACSKKEGEPLVGTLVHLARCYVAVGQYEHMTILPRRPLSRKIKRKIIMNERAGGSSLFALAACSPAYIIHIYKFTTPILNELITLEMSQPRKLRKKVVIVKDKNF